MTVMRQLCGLTLLLSLALPLQAEPLAKQQFGAMTQGSRQRPAAIGSYAKGCAAGAVQLPESGPTWQAMRLSRNRNWALPVAVDFAQDLSAFAATLPGWKGIYIGDMSQPRGGPMTTGHRSHQIGLDMDIWMMPATRVNLSARTRENLSAVSMRRAGGAYVNANWTTEQHALIRAAARDKRVARIFVFPGAKVQMCNDEKGDRTYLRKIRPWWGHHYHFHVRLTCPKGKRGCVNQAPPPPGDGCAEAQKWVDDIVNPPPPKPVDPNAPKVKPRREYVLADLPKKCVSVLRSK